MTSVQDDFNAVRWALKGYQEPMALEALERLEEQLEAAERRDDWLAKQLDGIIQDAEAHFRSIGSGTEASGGEGQSARAFLANLRDARAVVYPASEPS